MVGMPRISCFFGGAEPCILMVIMPISMPTMLMTMLILLIMFIAVMLMMFITPQRYIKKTLKSA